MLSQDLNTILPEIILSLYAMGALLAGVYTVKDKAASLLVWTTSTLFVIVAIWIGMSDGNTAAFSGMFNDDAYSRFGKVAVLLSAAAVLVMSQDYMQKRDLLRFEYPLLITLAVVGMMVMVSAGDLMVLYMGLELQSLALYVVASLRRDSVKSTEAGLKYFVLGALSSGLLLYGASLTYGFSGTTSFAGIIEATEGGVSHGLLFGLAFLITGFAFKVSAVPFHMWTPDVYEGAPTPVTAFFATAPKFAAMALFGRVVHDAFGNSIFEWQQIVALLSVGSMFLGAIAAIGQKDIIYVTMNVGTFAFILSMEKDGMPVTNIDALNMYSKREPVKALAMLVLLFSLAGVPPMLGFFGKFYVLQAAYDGGLAWLAVAGVVASVIGAFYYLRIVFFMYFGADQDEARLDAGTSPILWGFLIASAAVMVLGVINLFGIDPIAEAASLALVQ